MKLPEFEVDDALKIVGDYADVVWSTTDQQEQDTVQVAFAIESLYQKKAWVEQYQDRVPQIVERAITIGNEKLTGDIARQALNEWKLEDLGGNKVATKAGKKRRAEPALISGIVRGQHRDSI